MFEFKSWRKGHGTLFPRVRLGHLPTYLLVASFRFCFFHFVGPET